MPFLPKGRLFHHIPGWVPDGQTFHVRIRCDRSQRPQLTDPEIAGAMLDSVKFYHGEAKWWCRLFLIMPDHLHALLAFSREPGMSAILRQWKSFHSRRHQVNWQDGYFDHRVRSATEIDLKAEYIRQNPVVKGLCSQAADWPWVIGPSDLPSKPN